MFPIQTKFIEKEISYTEQSSALILFMINLIFWGMRSLLFKGLARLIFPNGRFRRCKTKKTDLFRKMVHFLIEHFEVSLKQMVSFQRILMVLILKNFYREQKIYLFIERR